MEHWKRDLTVAEIREIVGTGARPICFAESEDSYIWGFGSGFILNSKGNVYFITAKHVITNQKAKHQHARVIMPEAKIALPFTGAFTPQFPEHENRADVEDFIIFSVNDQLYAAESGADLESWNFDKWAWPTQKLEIGAQILLAGFPFTENRYDWDKNRISETLLISVGYLNHSELGNGIYKFEADPSELTFNGLSGAPVFCRREGYIFFTGLVIRGTSSSGLLHFIGAEFIRDALSFKEEGVYA